MKLLIVTQVVDATHPILGFFHRWIDEFADQTEKVTVVGQKVGSYGFKKQVTVFSLGKEHHASLASQICTFWGIIVRQHSSYDRVLVHMTPIWVVIGFPVWFLFRKKIYLWYEARGVRWPLRVSLFLVKKVFSASEFGMPLPTRKSVITGHGIDTEYFTISPEKREEGLIIIVGRITKAKKISTMLDAFDVLPDPYHLLIIGKPITPADKEYAEKLKEKIAHKGMKRRITIKPMSQRELKHILQSAELLLHASETSLDKAVLEAISCGCLVLSSSRAFAKFLPEESVCRPDRMSEGIQKLFDLPDVLKDKIRNDLRMKVEMEHSLPRLVRTLTAEMS